MPKEVKSEWKELVILLLTQDTRSSNSIKCISVYLFLCDRDELFRQSLSRLREQVVKANTLVREANFLAEEMNKLTDYQVTLQIPAANLSANRKVRLLNLFEMITLHSVISVFWSVKLRVREGVNIL